MPSISLNKRAIYSLLLSLVLVVTYLLPAILFSTKVSADQLTSRKITISTSKVSATDVTYFVSFNAGTAGANTIKGIVIQFCNSATGPLVGTACTGPTGFNINKATLTVANQKFNGSTVGNAYVINGASSSNTLILTNATGNSSTGGQSITFDLGTIATGSDGVTNPSTTGTFYARVLTYTNDTTAAAYTDISPGSHLDEGGIALSTANQLTVSARVQETLQFCVGTTSVDNESADIADDCADGTVTGSCGTSVDLGVLDSSQVSISPVQVAAGTPGGGNNCNGYTQVRTNASAGVVITYFAEQDSSSGQLKIAGQSCTPSSTTDKCFNDSATQAAFTAGTEAFGVTVAGINHHGSTSYSCTYAATPNTCKLEPSSGSTGYLGSGSVGSELFGHTNGFAWVDNNGNNPQGFPTTLASSTGPVDDEITVLEFAATPTITTPTGTYTVTSTYIATATF